MCILFKFAQYFISPGRVALAARAAKEVGPCAAHGRRGRWLTHANHGEQGRWLPRVARDGREGRPPLARLRSTRSSAAPLTAYRKQSLDKLLVSRECGPVDVLVRCKRREGAELLVPRPPQARPANVLLRPEQKPAKLLVRHERRRVRHERALRPLLARGEQRRPPPRAAHGGRGCRPVLARDGQGGWPASARGGRARRRARAENNVGCPATITAEEDIGLAASSLFVLSALRSISLPIAQR